MSILTPLEYSEIARVLSRYHDAMVAASTDTLEALLDREFTLVHITGYVQPKDEWFSVMRSGDFDYHAIDVDASSLRIEGTDLSAELNGRGVFNATIHGMKRPWRLAFRMSLKRLSKGWVILGARYSSY
jgi:hypothetical protein